MSNIFSKSESTRLQSVTTQVSPKHLEAEHGRISATKVTSVNLIYDTNIFNTGMWNPVLVVEAQHKSEFDGFWSSRYIQEHEYCLLFA